MKRWSALLVGLTLVTASAATALDRIAPGVDLWVTYGNGATYSDFARNPIPAAFFCPESKAFTDRIVWRGAPVIKDSAVDTIVERLDEATFGANGVATTRTRVRALGLQGLDELATECGNYRVRAYLAPGEQPLSTMRIEQSRTDGGTFTSTLALNIRMVFEPTEKGRATLTLDDAVVFGRSTVIPWSLRPDSSFALTADTNGDGKGDTRLTSSSGFTAGVGDGLATAGGHCSELDASGTICLHYHQVYGCYYDFRQGYTCVAEP